MSDPNTLPSTFVSFYAVNCQRQNIFLAELTSTVRSLNSQSSLQRKSFDPNLAGKHHANLKGLQNE